MNFDVCRVECMWRALTSEGREWHSGVATKCEICQSLYVVGLLTATRVVWCWNIPQTCWAREIECIEKKNIPNSVCTRRGLIHFWLFSPAAQRDSSKYNKPLSTQPSVQSYENFIFLSETRPSAHTKLRENLCFTFCLLILVFSYLPFMCCVSICDTNGAIRTFNVHCADNNNNNNININNDITTG